MIIPDVNLLIYAHRREDPHHEYYKSWLEDLANGSEPFGLSTLVASAFVRIVTHPSFRPFPTPLIQAVSVIDSLRSVSSCIMISPGEKHWDLLRDLCIRSQSTGKLIGDAQHAAVALEHGGILATRDLDFERFSPLGLKHIIVMP
jgi:toxin-antitoxin system PIN domain toxin